MLAAVADPTLDRPALSMRGVGGSFWSDPLGEIERGIRHGLSDFESDVRHGLSDAESDVRHSLKDFERKNREGIQLATAGAACAVGTAYLGPAASPLVCAPLSQKLATPGAPGVLVDPNNPADPNLAEAQAYMDANPWVASPASIAGLNPLVIGGLLVVLLLLFARRRR